jgi:hypothetical protein
MELRISDQGPESSGRGGGISFSCATAQGRARLSYRIAISRRRVAASANLSKGWFFFSALRNCGAYQNQARF